MTSFFSRLGASFTPSFLARFRKVTVGQSIGYYFLTWLFIILLGAVILLGLTWRLSTPQRVGTLLARVPAFELQFVDNVLTKTSFKEDPYVLVLGKDAQIFVSTQLTDMPEGYENIAGFYLLRDSVIINQPQQAAQKITKIQYTEVKIGDKTINNAFLNEKLLTKYPPFRKAFLYLVIPFSLIVGLAMACFFFLMSLFWSLVIFLVSKISSLPRLSYEQALVFILHIFLPVFLLVGILTWLDMYFVFLPTILFIGVFLANARATGLSQSTHKK